MKKRVYIIVSMLLMVMLLAACAKSDEQAKDESKKIAVSASEVAVLCVDENGTPIEGVMAVFCDESTCRNAYSDQDGIARMDEMQGQVEVHIARAPEGYDFSDNTEIMTPGGDSITFVLTKTK